MVAQQMLAEILGAAETALTINGQALKAPARVGGQDVLPQIALVGIAAIAARLGACKSRFVLCRMFSSDMGTQIAWLLVAALALLALVAFASVQRFTAMFCVERPFVELLFALRAGVELAAALVAFLLPLLIEAAVTLLAPKRIRLCVLCNLVAAQFHLLPELGRAMCARIFARTLMCFAHVSRHIAGRCEHLAALRQTAFDCFLQCRRTLVCAAQMTLQMGDNRITLITALVAASMLFLQEQLVSWLMETALVSFFDLQCRCDGIHGDPIGPDA